MCDTFLPALDLGGGRLSPAASDLGVPDAIEEGLAFASPLEGRRLKGLLSILGGRGATAAGGGGLRRFSRLGQAERERALLTWADSRHPQRRAAFHALRKAALATCYGSGTDGVANPLWPAIGDPGPPGIDAGARDAPIDVLEVRRHAGLSCDVVVVGSGAGGGVTASVLAEAGLDVVVVEAGEQFGPTDFDGGELEAFRRFYDSGGGLATEDQGVGIVAGSMLGGGTEINYTTSFRTPDDVRDEWGRCGVGAFAGEPYERALSAVSERMGVTQELSRPSRRDQRMLTGLSRLGWHAGRVPRNATERCDQGDRCGYCGYGCPFGAKRSSLDAWLRGAVHNHGTRVLTRTHVDRVLVRDGAAAGVVARHRPTGADVVVTARAVVAAGGAIHTPALMLRSGCANRNVGRHLRLHAGFGVAGVYEDEMRPWGGTMQAVYSDRFRDLDGEGYGVKMVTLPVHPAVLAQFAPWRSPAQHFELMASLPNTFLVGLQLRDRTGGRVRLGRDRRPVVSYRHVRRDLEHLRTALRGAAELHLAAGARRVYTGHARPVETRSDPDELVRLADAAGWGPGRCVYSSFHQLGSARMGGAPSTAACDPTGQSFDVRNLVVCDGSALPTATGVNPMLTISATAWMNASELVDRLN